MFSMTVKPWRNSKRFLGIGTYYLRSDSRAQKPGGGWVKVTLTNPLFLTARQIRMLAQKYGTESVDAMSAMAGAWCLRRDLLELGYDGIVGVGPVSNEARFTVVELTRTSAERGLSSLRGGRGAGASVRRLSQAACGAVR